MSDDLNHYLESLIEVRVAREEAQTLRDQLLAACQRVQEEQDSLPPELRDDPRRRQGAEAMRLALTAADRAVKSIDQALRELQRVRDDDSE